MFRSGLKIAWCLCFAMLTATLGVLWVRSYSLSDALLIPTSGAEGLRLGSNRGRIGSEPDPTATGWEWTTLSLKLGYFANFDWARWERTTPHWIFKRDGSVLVPHWFLLAIAGTLSAAPWLPTRFSFRTLLTAMTLAALWLGAVAYWSL